jgi:hypothetical protein
MKKHFWVLLLAVALALALTACGGDKGNGGTEPGVFGNRKVDRIGTRKVDHLRYNPGGYPLPPRG